jgi:hypothetical protein
VGIDVMDDRTIGDQRIVSQDTGCRSHHTKDPGSMDTSKQGRHKG